MKKLLIFLISLFISLNSYGEEINSLFGITLYDNAEKYVSSNYIDSNKVKNKETIDGYFDLIMTDKIKITSPYLSWYKITINKDNRVHSIYGSDKVANLEICQEVSATDDMAIQTYGNVTIFQADMPCVACGNAGCDNYGKSDCLYNISPGLVFKEIEDWYQKISF